MRYRVYISFRHNNNLTFYTDTNVLERVESASTPFIRINGQYRTTSYNDGKTIVSVTENSYMIQLDDITYITQRGAEDEN